MFFHTRTPEFDPPKPHVAKQKTMEHIGDLSGGQVKTIIFLELPNLLGKSQVMKDRIHTYIHTYMHACMHTYIHTYIHSPMWCPFSKLQLEPGPES